MNTISVVQIQAELTEGDTPAVVFMSPWTIQGWRPFSVSNQPAVFMRNGMMTAQVATARNTRERSRRCRHTAQAPHSARSKARLPRYAIARIDQYWMNTLGT